MGKSCRDMAEALRDCMILEECMSDGSRTLKQCLKLKEYSHECRVRGCSVEGTTIRVGGPGGHCMVLLHSVSLTVGVCGMHLGIRTVCRDTAKRISSASEVNWICAHGSEDRRVG